jgi:hypothetical protein
MRSGQRQANMARTGPHLISVRRALLAIAIVAGIAGIGGAVVLHHRSEEHEHTMKCLAAYMAFIQVIGGRQEESVERLKACEQSRTGEEPIHLGPREHPFVVTQYEACLAAHLLMASDLDKSLAQQRQYCH